MDKARAVLLKKIETGYRPLQKTLDKYNITDAEGKPPSTPQKRDNRQNAKNTYNRYTHEINRRNILYRVATTGRIPSEGTLQKYGLPSDINALHPIVLNRKKSSVSQEDGSAASGVVV